jgi:hypothetical protein
MPLFSSSLSGLILNPRYNNLLCSCKWKAKLASCVRNRAEEPPVFSLALPSRLFSHLCVCTHTDPYDAGTSERRCDPIGRSGSCIPGCTYGDWARWCDDEPGWPCAWPPDHLAESIARRDRIAAAGGNTWERDAPADFVKEGGCAPAARARRTRPPHAPAARARRTPHAARTRRTRPPHARGRSDRREKAVQPGIPGYPPCLLDGSLFLITSLPYRSPRGAALPS